MRNEWKKWLYCAVFVYKVNWTIMSCCENAVVWFSAHRLCFCRLGVNVTALSKVWLTDSDSFVLLNAPYSPVHSLFIWINWTHNTDALHRRGQSRLYLLRRLRSFGVRGPLLSSFYDSVVASAFCTVWSDGAAASQRDRSWTRSPGSPVQSWAVLWTRFGRWGTRESRVKLRAMLDHPSSCRRLCQSQESSFSDRSTLAVPRRALAGPSYLLLLDSTMNIFNLV